MYEIIAQLKDADGVIQIPGFYDKVVDLTPDDRKAMADLPFDETAYKASLDVDAVHGEKGYTTLERASARPTLDVNGLWGGYQGEGAKTVLPSKAKAKISMRLVPNQDPHEIAELFKQQVLSLAPETVKIKVTEHHGGYASRTDLNFHGLKAAAAAFEDIYHTKVLFSMEGGSIPIVADFKRVLDAESISWVWCYQRCYSLPNESFHVKDFYRGIKTLLDFSNCWQKMLPLDFFIK